VASQNQANLVNRANRANRASPAPTVSVSLGARPGRPIGVSPQVTGINITTTAGTTTWWPGDRWPPDGLPVTWPNMPLGTGFLNAGTVFPESAWGPDYYAFVVLADFVAAPGPPGPWNNMLVGVSPPTTTGAPSISDELNELAQLVYYRPSVLAEAMAQNAAILQYFSGILSFNLRSHPATVYLCTAALRIGSFQAMYYKYKYDRARPSRLSPRLMPPIDPPGHASFPSGHATQARLIALCLEQVMPSAIIPVISSVSNPDAGPLRKMADRIARNREVLGLHYPSDSKAGKALADETFSLMMKGTPPPTSTPSAPSTPLKKIDDLITEAKKEWS
jgi:membrane-associated phospholipid phosphatase